LSNSSVQVVAVAISSPQFCAGRDCQSVSGVGCSVDLWDHFGIFYDLCHQNLRVQNVLVASLNDGSIKEDKMIQVKQLAHVCIFADDIEETRAFYKQALGLDTAFNFLRDEKIFGFYLNTGGRAHIEVFEKEAASFDEFNQINHLCLEVDNIDAAIAHLRDMNIEVTAKKLACDSTYQAWIKDPNGVKIELFEYTSDSAQFVGRDRVADW
jgi:lactoylglutathione lyase/glyoxylase I family protein